MNKDLQMLLNIDLRVMILLENQSSFQNTLSNHFGYATPHCHTNRTKHIVSIYSWGKNECLYLTPELGLKCRNKIIHITANLPK